MTKFRCLCGAIEEHQIPTGKSAMTFGNELTCSKCRRKGMSAMFN